MTPTASPRSTSPSPGITPQPPVPDRTLSKSSDIPPQGSSIVVDMAPPIPPRASSLAAARSARKREASLAPTHKRKARWDDNFATKSIDELNRKIALVRQNLNQQTKQVKLSTLFDSNFWPKHIEIARLLKDRTIMEFRLSFLEYAATNDEMSLEKWEEK